MTDTAPTAPARPYVPAGLRILHAAIRDAGTTAPGATVTVTLTVPEDPHAALLITDAVVTPLPERIPPAPPTPCYACSATYRACTVKLRGEFGKACCGSCYSTATHGQHPWETFHGGSALDQLPADPS